MLLLLFVALFCEIRMVVEQDQQQQRPLLIGPPIQRQPNLHLVVYKREPVQPSLYLQYRDPPADFRCHLSLECPLNACQIGVNAATMYLGWVIHEFREQHYLNQLPTHDNFCSKAKVFEQRGVFTIDYYVSPDLHWQTVKEFTNRAVAHLFPNFNRQ